MQQMHNSECKAWDAVLGSYGGIGPGRSRRRLGVSWAVVFSFSRLGMAPTQPLRLLQSSCVCGVWGWGCARMSTTTWDRYCLGSHREVISVPSGELIARRRFGRPPAS